MQREAAQRIGVKAGHYCRSAVAFKVWDTPDQNDDVEGTVPVP